MRCSRVWRECPRLSTPAGPWLRSLAQTVWTLRGHHSLGQRDTHRRAVRAQSLELRTREAPGPVSAAPGRAVGMNVPVSISASPSHPHFPLRTSTSTFPRSIFSSSFPVLILCKRKTLPHVHAVQRAGPILNAHLWSGRWGSCVTLRTWGHSSPDPVSPCQGPHSDALVISTSHLKPRA